MNKLKALMLMVLFLGLGFGAGYIMLPHIDGSADTESSGGEDKPLYWVAPMDSNYRRDKPGKSPMGMDLVPVYEKDHDEGGDSMGTVRISPTVEHNLGVRIEKVSKKTLNNQIRTVGYVKYNQDQLIHIHPRVSGWVEKLYVKAEGDPVKKGQPLYDLYSPALVNAQEEYVLALDRKNTRLVQAAENRLQSLQLPSDVIRTLKRTRKVQQNITLSSPQSGVIDNLNIREGFYVQPGTTVMSIGNLDEVWVEAEVLERQAALVGVDAKVEMILDYLPGILWQGKVDYVYPTLDEKTRSIKVRMRFQNKDQQLKPNMFAQITIQGQSDEPLLLIPKEALIRTGKSNRVVLALGQGKFKSIAVKTGRFDDEKIEILNGLSEGEDVVVSAQFLLDSESSKTSDFKRMDHQQDASTAEVMGVVNSVDVESRSLNISREGIPKWNRGPATLNFVAHENVDLREVTAGMNIHFVFSLSPQREFVIHQLHPMSDMADMKSDAAEAVK